MLDPIAAASREVDAAPITPTLVIGLAILGSAKEFCLNILDVELFTAEIGGDWTKRLENPMGRFTSSEFLLESVMSKIPEVEIRVEIGDR